MCAALPQVRVPTRSQSIYRAVRHYCLTAPTHRPYLPWSGGRSVITVITKDQLQVLWQHLSMAFCREDGDWPEFARVSEVLQFCPPKCGRALFPRRAQRSGETCFQGDGKKSLKCYPEKESEGELGVPTRGLAFSCVTSQSAQAPFQNHCYSQFTGARKQVGEVQELAKARIWNQVSVQNTRSHTLSCSPTRNCSLY